MGKPKIKTKAPHAIRIATVLRRPDGKMVKRNRIDGGWGKKTLREFSGEKP